MPNRLNATFGRSTFLKGHRKGSASLTAPTVTDLDISNVTQTSFTVTWTCSEAVTGQVQYGTTTALGSSTTAETDFITTHIQTVSGLLPGLLYYVRVVGQDADGNAYAADATATTQSDGSSISYTDVTLPGSVGSPGIVLQGGNNYLIYHDGSVDSAPGINYFIQQQADGADATNHTRIIFPPTSTFRIDTGICVGGKNHMTLWGHAATSSAWRRGDATSYQDVGARINVYEDTVSSPRCSAFISGSKYVGYRSINFGQGGSDVIIRGFDIYGMTTTNPGFMQGGGGSEVHASIEMGTQTDVQFCYNRSRGMGGDLVRFRTSKRGWVHHNYVLTTGRMGGSFIVNPSPSDPANLVYEDNTVDRAGYWFLDIETEDDPTVSNRYLDGVTIRRNLFGNCGTTSDRGFLAFSYIGTHVHIADVSVEDNEVDGYSWDSFAGASGRYRGLRTNINERLVTSVPTGSDPRIQRATFRNNSVTHSAETYTGPIVNAKYVDVLVVTGNDGNMSSGSFLSTTSCTSVTNTGNT